MKSCVKNNKYSYKQRKHLFSDLRNILSTLNLNNNLQISDTQLIIVFPEHISGVDYSKEVSDTYSRLQIYFKNNIYWDIEYPSLQEFSGNLSRYTILIQMSLKAQLDLFPVF